MTAGTWRKERWRLRNCLPAGRPATVSHLTSLHASRLLPYAVHLCEVLFRMGGPHSRADATFEPDRCRKPVSRLWSSRWLLWRWGRLWPSPWPTQCPWDSRAEALLKAPVTKGFGANRLWENALPPRNRAINQAHAWPCPSFASPASAARLSSRSVVATAKPTRATASAGLIVSGNITMASADQRAVAHRATHSSATLLPTSSHDPASLRNQDCRRRSGRGREAVSTRGLGDSCVLRLWAREEGNASQTGAD